MKLRYFSHSAFQITTETGQRILIDPFLDPKNFKQKVEAKGISCQVLEFGQEITI